MNVAVAELMEQVDAARLELPRKPSAPGVGPLPFAVMLGALEAEAEAEYVEEPAAATPDEPSQERAPVRDDARQPQEAPLAAREVIEPPLPEARALRTGDFGALPVARVEQAPTLAQAGPGLRPAALRGPSAHSAPASALAAVDPSVSDEHELTPPEVGDRLPSDRGQRPAGSDAVTNPRPEGPQPRPDEKQAAQVAPSPSDPSPGRDRAPEVSAATGDVAARAIGRSPAELGAAKASAPGETRPGAASREPGPARGMPATAPGPQEATAPDRIVEAAPRPHREPETEPGEPRFAMAPKLGSASSAPDAFAPSAPSASAPGIAAQSAHAGLDSMPASPIAPPAAPASTAPVSAMPESATSSRVELVAERIEWLTQRGGGSARVELDPPHLGHLELSVRVRGGEVDLRIVTHESSVFQLVQSERSQLADSLAGRELRLGTFDVRGESSSSDSGPPKQGSEHRSREDAVDPGAPVPRAVEPSSQRTLTDSVVGRTSRLDLRI